MKYLNVAQKNSVAKSIADVLSGGTHVTHEGLSLCNKIYKFQANLSGTNCSMIMTSVSGHLLKLEFIPQYNTPQSWNAGNILPLFEAPIVRICNSRNQNIKETLEREVRDCDGLILWTDCNREGENIGFEIIEVCTAVREDLRVLRARFSEITFQSISRALHNLEQPNQIISDAVEVRKHIDLRTGAAFTRFLTHLLRTNYPAIIGERVISYGSCQFPTLGFVVERYRAVENFVPEQFWKIEVSHNINVLSVDFLWQPNRLFDEKECRGRCNVCLENSTATVMNIETNHVSKERPLPLNTVELEKAASRNLNINANETMRLAEELYTRGYISYPCTETNKFPTGMNLNDHVRLQVDDARWGTFAENILQGGGATPSEGNKFDEAHLPIYPTKGNSDLRGDEQRLHEFIVRCFLACCHRDAQGRETTVTVDIAQETFTASGLIITESNYLDVYSYDEWSPKEIHVYQVGHQFTPTRLEVTEGQTSAQSLLTEADLIDLMDQHEIGTDATHASHIEKIKDRSYVELDNNLHFVPSMLGLGLIEGFEAIGLSLGGPLLRAHLEANIRDICAGRRAPNDVLAEQIQLYRTAYSTLETEADAFVRPLSMRLNPGN